MPGPSAPPPAPPRAYTVSVPLEDPSSSSYKDANTHLTATPEFPPITTTHRMSMSLEASRREASIALGHAFDIGSIAGMAAAALSVFGFGMWEGKLQCKPGVPARAFAMQYSKAQMLPSIIWMTKPAAVVARAMGKSPSSILRELSPELPKDASILLRVQTAATMRSIIAGFVGISQILRLVNTGADARSTYEQRLVDGKEPHLRGVRETVIRLAGTSSDVTELSLLRDGAHVLPIMEKPDLFKNLVLQHSVGLSHPVLWHIPTGGYGMLRNWLGFRVYPEWLLTTRQKRRLLVVEADSSVGEQALALGTESANDLTLQEASQAFHSIRSIATKQKALDPQRGDQMSRVLLADSRMVMHTGGGHTRTIRDLVEATRECDVLIDAKMPLIKAILLWAQDAHHKLPAVDEGTKQRVQVQVDKQATGTWSHWKASHPHGYERAIIFDTSNPEYFNTVKTILERDGWVVLDSGDLPLTCGRFLPRLVYQQSTANTVNTMRSLLSSGHATPQACCALLDSHEGLQHLQSLSSELGVSLPCVCSSVIYDDLFRFVRRKLRDDVPYTDIQRLLDRTFAQPGPFKKV